MALTHSEPSCIKVARRQGFLQSLAEASRYVNRRSMEWKGHNQGSDDSSNNSQAKKAPAINIDLNHVCRAYNEHTGVYVCFLPQEHISETYDVCASYMLLYTLNYHRHQILVYMLH